MPVINPIWFYLMSVCDVLKMLAIPIAILSGIFVVGSLCDDVAEEYVKRFLKRASAVLCISVAVLVFCPSSKTLEKMLIAQNVTYERVEQATDVVSNVYEDIMNLFEKDKE